MADDDLESEEEQDETKRPVGIFALKQASSSKLQASLS